MGVRRKVRKTVIRVGEATIDSTRDSHDNNRRSSIIIVIRTTLPIILRSSCCSVLTLSVSVEAAATLHSASP